MTEKEFSDFMDQMISLENEIAVIREDMKDSFNSISKKTKIPVKVLKASVKAARSGKLEEIINDANLVEEVLKKAGRA